MFAASVASPAASRSRLGRLSAALGLPVPVTVGARSAFGNRGRAVLTGLCLALTVASVVATMGMEVSLRLDAKPPPAIAAVALDPVAVPGDGEALRPIVYGLDVVLLGVRSRISRPRSCSACGNASAISRC